MTKLVLMGSGETAPSMTRIHRDVIQRTPSGSMVMVDTPYGFQVNAGDLSARTQKYFRESVGATVDLAPWRRRDEPAPVRDATLAQITTAQWLFAGPGSPTYALNHWSGTPFVGAVQDLLDRGGTLVLGSAAAVTVGEFALPVYEIYKVGAEPSWAAGLDLLNRTAGIRAAVIPHFDNSEGGTYDTRFCYLGERRLTQLERELSEDVAVLGVDEHTAVILDLGSARVEVLGSGGLTVRRGGTSTVIEAGSTLALTDLAGLVRGAATGVTGPPPALHTPARSAPPKNQPSLDGDVARLRHEFDHAMQTKDVSACVEALLGLEAAIHDWSADTLQSDSADRARRELRAMVVRLGGLAQAGATDPRQLIAPCVEALLDVRDRARQVKDFETSDLIRDRLTRAGVQVQDNPGGSSWELLDRPS